MKIVIASALLALGTAAALVPTTPAKAACTSCSIQSKTPSATAPGKFDYTVSCIQDASGDELVSKVTASNDDEAKMLAQQKC